MAKWLKGPSPPSSCCLPSASRVCLRRKLATVPLSARLGSSLTYLLPRRTACPCRPCRTYRRHFGEALKYDPDFKAAKTEFSKVKEYDRKRNRAQSAAQEQRWADAESAFGEALHVDPRHRVGNRGLWQGLGEARYQQAKHDAAIEAFRAVLSLSGGSDETASAWVIRSLLAAERWQEAVNQARESVNQFQQSHELRGLLGEAEKRLKMSLRKDYYKLLGVEKHAGDREIKSAYRQLAKQVGVGRVWTRAVEGEGGERVRAAGHAGMCVWG